MGRTGASQDPPSRSKHLLRRRTYRQHRAGVVWASDGQKPAGSISSAFEEGEGAWREGRDICFRHQQHSQNQHLSLALFLHCSWKALGGKDRAGHCDTEVVRPILLVCNGPANSPLERLFCSPLSLHAAFSCEEFMPRAIRFPEQNDQKYGFHKVLLCAWNGVHNEPAKLVLCSVYWRLVRTFCSHWQQYWN